MSQALVHEDSGGKKKPVAIEEEAADRSRVKVGEKENGQHRRRDPHGIPEEASPDEQKESHDGVELLFITERPGLTEEVVGGRADEARADPLGQRGVAEPLSGSEFEERLFVKQRLPAKERGSSQNGQSEEAGGPIGWKDSTKAPFEEGGRGHL